MSGYFAAGKLTEEERENILSQHRHVYNGYRTMQPQVNNQQPLYVQDFAKDKVGAVVNNKGVVKPYTNVGINESTEQKEVCDECGSMMMEGECSECGWKGEVGDMEEQMDDEVNWEEDDFDQMPTPDDSIFGKEKQIEKKEKPAGFRPGVDFGNAFEKFKNTLDEYDDGEENSESNERDHKIHRRTGKFKKHQYTEPEVSEYETGHLDDIYDEEDLNPNAEFDYVKGASNKTNAFHIKEQADDYIDNFEDPDNEDDGFEDINASEVTDGELEELSPHDLERGKKYKYNTPSFEDEIEFDNDFEDKGGGKKMFKFKGKDKTSHLMPGKHIEDFVKYLDEQGYTGGGNAPDMDISNIDPAYDFVSDGPMAGGDVYYTEGEVDEEECDECWDKMESAWSEEIDEVDVSGAQGIYGAMEPAFDFDSEGPGKAGPYQHSQYSENENEDEDVYWEKDLEPNELDLDFEKFNPRDKSWEEITAHTGDDEFGGVDEDIRESLITQKNKIMEMMNRMKVIK